MKVPDMGGAAPIPLPERDAALRCLLQTTLQNLLRVIDLETDSRHLDGERIEFTTNRSPRTGESEPGLSGMPAAPEQPATPRSAEAGECYALAPPRTGPTAGKAEPLSDQPATPPAPGQPAIQAAPKEGESTTRTAPPPDRSAPEAATRVDPTPTPVAPTAGRPARGADHSAGRPPRPYPLMYFRSEEPRALLLGDLLASCLRLGRLGEGPDGPPATGWSLKDLRHWQVDDDTDPGTILGNISWFCKVKCKFCYQIGHPPELRAPRFTTPRQEILTKIRHYDPVKGKRLFHPTNYDTNEILTYPEILDLMRLLREKTARPFYNITTNGVPLTEELIAGLESLQPFELGISINSTNPALRKLLMRDRQPQVAIGSMARLRERGIAFLASIVAWPEFTLADLEQTLRDLDRIEPAEVRVCLPGYSKYFSAEKLFDREEVWRGIVDLIRRLRPELRVPVIPLPSIYEEHVYDEFHNLPYVQGVVPGSPAEAAGLRRGDVIRRANNINVSDRPQARYLLAKLHEDGCRIVWLVAEREGREVEVILKERFGEGGGYRFPYTRHFASLHRMPYGIILPQGVGREAIEGLVRQVRAAGARRVLLLTSTLMKKPMMQLVAASGGLEGVDVQWEIPENRYLGENIFIGDLLTVEDYVEHLRERAAAGAPRPDLVLVPSSPFSTWRRDIAGRTFYEIGRRTGLPVEMLYVQRIWC